MAAPTWGKRPSVKVALVPQMDTPLFREAIRVATEMRFTVRLQILSGGGGAAGLSQAAIRAHGYVVK